MVTGEMVKIPVHASGLNNNWGWLTCEYTNDLVQGWVKEALGRFKSY
jgi:hypothetical protein